MQAFIKGNFAMAYGDSLNDVAAYIAATPIQWRSIDSVRTSASDSWDLNCGWAGALRLAREGWSQGAADLHDRLQAIPPPTNTHAKERRDVAGFYPDVPRFLGGDPAHMVRKGERHGADPVIHFVVNGSASAYIRSSQMRNYGAALCAIIDKLEASNRRVELDVVFCANVNKGRKSVVGWKVKRAGEQLDLSAVAFSLAHPANLRRIGFALMEREPLDFEAYGHGHPASISKDFVRFMDAEDAILLDGINENPEVCHNAKQALNFLAQRVNKAVGEELLEVA